MKPLCSTSLSTLRALRIRHVSRSALRYKSNKTGPPPLAFAFDIDGVLLRGESVIPSVSKVFNILHGDNPWNAKIPFILMTNGGGISEAHRAMLLSRQLNTKIHQEQLIQSHTVLRSLGNDALPGESLAEDHVLVVGGIGDAVRQVADGYGFKNVHTTLDILAWNPSIWPFHRITEDELESTRKTDFSKIPISTIFVVHDPRNWALDIQIMTDVIRSYPNGLGSSYPSHSYPGKDNDGNGHGHDKRVKLYFSNPDLLWKARYHVPRFGQGAFKEAFQAVFKAATGSKYPYIQYGKPHKLTYDYGKRMINAQHEALHGSHDHNKSPTVFMVGDNPESDIAGANAAGWKSLLVSTGVYDPSSGRPPAHNPTEIVGDVEDAVRRGIEIVLAEEARD